MEYSEFEYKRAEIKEIQKSFKELIRQFDDADSFQEQCSIIDKINEIRDEFASMQVLSELKKCLGEDKKLYSKEVDYYNEADPILDGLVCDYYKVLYDSKFKEQLKEKFGEQLFKLAEMTMKKYQYFLILNGNVCNLFWKLWSLNEENFNSIGRKNSTNSL